MPSSAKLKLATASSKLANNWLGASYPLATYQLNTKIGLHTNHHHHHPPPTTHHTNFSRDSRLIRRLRISI